MDFFYCVGGRDIYHRTLSPPTFCFDTSNFWNTGWGGAYGYLHAISAAFGILSSCFLYLRCMDHEFWSGGVERDLISLVSKSAFESSLWCLGGMIHSME